MHHLNILKGGLFPKFEMVFELIDLSKTTQDKWNYDLKIINKFLKTAVKFKYLGNSNKSKLRSQTSLVQRMYIPFSSFNFCFLLVSEKLIMKIYKTKFLYIFCMDVKFGLT
jgi:hypothetical protein